MIEKIDHKPMIPREIRLPNTIPNDTDSKKGNRFMALGSYEKIIYMKTMFFIYLVTFLYNKRIFREAFQSYIFYNVSQKKTLRLARYIQC